MYEMKINFKMENALHRQCDHVRRDLNVFRKFRARMFQQTTNQPLV